jgi:hypothetical protein
MIWSASLCNAYSIIGRLESLPHIIGGLGSLSHCLIGRLESLPHFAVDYM